MMQQRIKSLLVILIGILLTTIHCTVTFIDANTGGSTDVVCKGQILESVVALTTSDQLQGASGIEVFLLPADFNPLIDSVRGDLSDITDSLGYYVINRVPKGIYALNARDTIRGLLTYRNMLLVSDSTVQVDFGSDTIRRTGNLMMNFQDSSIELPAHLYIPGSPYYYNVPDDSVVEINLVSSSNLKMVWYYPQTEKSVPFNVLSGTINVYPDSTTHVTLKNSPPVIVSTSDDIDSTIDIGTRYADTISAIDPDGDSVFYKLAEGPEGMYVDRITGTVSWLPGLEDTGSFTVRVFVLDSRGLQDEIEWNIKVIIRNKLSKMIFINSRNKSFIMGDSSIDGKSLPHTVNFTYDYYIDSVEITRNEYYKLNMGAASAGGNDSCLPINNVNWFDAILYANKLSKVHGLDTVYEYTSIKYDQSEGTYKWENLKINYSRLGYRLPTEAEWEYACRGGTVTSLFCDVSVLLQFAAMDELIAVGRLMPNQFGLYDMVGNVSEWCNDWYGNYPSGPVVNPSNSAFCPRSMRVYRGSQASSASRSAGLPQGRSDRLGFRLALGTFDPDTGALYTDIHGMRKIQEKNYEFFIDTAEITQGEYERLMNVNPTTGEKGARLPVDNITWFDAVLFCNARSKRDELDTVYSYTSITGVIGNGCSGLENLSFDFSKNGYRLPIESEWECVSTTPLFSSNFQSNQNANEYAWYVINSNGILHEVARKLSNEYGIYDLIGNVSEWIHDWYKDKRDTFLYPEGPESGTDKVYRGGNYNSSLVENDMVGTTILLNRTSLNPSQRQAGTGFRVVCGKRY